MYKLLLTNLQSITIDVLLFRQRFICMVSNHFSTHRTLTCRDLKLVEIIHHLEQLHTFSIIFFVKVPYNSNGVVSKDHFENTACGHRLALTLTNLVEKQITFYECLLVVF